MPEDKTNQAILASTALTAIGVAVMAIRSGVKGAAGGVVTLSKEVMDLLAAMAQGIAATLVKLDAILDAIKAGGGAGGSGFPPNADGIMAQYVNCPQVQPNAYQLPDIPIPHSMALVIEARNPGGVNTGLVFLAGNQPNAGGNNQSAPLIPGATKSYRVKNAKSIWVGAAVGGEGVYITVEQNNA